MELERPSQQTDDIPHLPTDEGAPELKGRVLIMDDDMLVRSLATDMLSVLGYFPRCARHGEEAIALYRHAQQAEEAFHAVILDIKIEGGLGGAETISRLIEVNPDIKAIVSSGSHDDPVLKNYKDYGFRACLPKPYTLKELSQTLEAVMSPSLASPLHPTLQTSAKTAHP